MKQKNQRKTQHNYNKPATNFTKIQAAPGGMSKNISHIIKKYNQVNLGNNIKNSSLPMERNKNIQHKRIKQKGNILDSISKNINQVKDQSIKDSSYKKQRVLNNQPKRQQNIIYQKKNTKSSYKKTLSHASSGENRMMGRSIQKKNKFLLSNIPNKNTLEKKRNFSPITGGQLPIKTNELFPKKKTYNMARNNLNQSHKPKANYLKDSSQNIEDSLGGGSKINTKTGSMINFGNSSRIPDNLSIISRYKREKINRKRIQYVKSNVIQTNFIQ